MQLGGKGVGRERGRGGGLPTIAAVWVQLLLCITEHHARKIYEEAQWSALSCYWWHVMLAAVHTLTSPCAANCDSHFCMPNLQASHYTGQTFQTQQLLWVTAIYNIIRKIMQLCSLYTDHHFQKQLQTVDISLSPHDTCWCGVSLTCRARKRVVTMFHMQQGNIYGHNIVTTLNLATWPVGFSQSHVFTSCLQWCSTAYLARGYRHFEGTCCLHLHSKRVKMDAGGSSKIWMPKTKLWSITSQNTMIWIL